MEKNIPKTNIQKQENVLCAEVKSIKFIGYEDVYNMEVEETHNFIANGVVIHNCIDSVRYALENDTKQNNIQIGYNRVI